MPPDARAEALDCAAVSDYLYRAGRTDGLPVIPPTRGRVEAVLMGTGLARDRVVAVLGPRRGLATVEKVAINAVMAGCEPRHLPVVLAATEAVGTGDYWEEKREFTERWQMSPDAKTWTFFLRRGVPFHEGWGEVAAEDVKFSLELLMRKEAIATTTPHWRKLIDRIEVIDRHTVRLHLKASDPDLLFELSSGREVQIVSKKHIETVGVEKAAEQPVGTGPYRLVEWRRGEFMRYKALDEHWRVVPQFKELIYKFVPEDSTRVAMLRTGEADIIELSRSLKKDVQAAGFEARRALWPGVVVFGFLGGQYLKERPTFDPKIPWLDKRVREAINLAVTEYAAGVRVTAKERKMAGVGWLHRTGIPPDPPSHLAVFFTTEAILGGVELPELEDRFARLRKTADLKERAKAIREIGEVLYSGYHTLPLVDLYPLFGINQKKVGAWKTTGYYSYTHLEYAQKK